MDDRLHWQVRDVEGTVPARSAELRWDGVDDSTGACDC
jgi:hypothetical protein